MKRIDRKYSDDITQRGTDRLKLKLNIPVGFDPLNKEAARVALIDIAQSRKPEVYNHKIRDGFWISETYTISAKEIHMSPKRFIDEYINI